MAIKKYRIWIHDDKEGYRVVLKLDPTGDGLEVNEKEAKDKYGERFIKIKEF